MNASGIATRQPIVALIAYLIVIVIVFAIAVCLFNVFKYVKCWLKSGSAEQRTSPSASIDQSNRTAEQARQTVFAQKPPQSSKGLTVEMGASKAGNNLSLSRTQTHTHNYTQFDTFSLFLDVI